MTADARERSRPDQRGPEQRGPEQRSGTGLTGTFGTTAVRTGPPRDFGPFDADDLDEPDPEATDPAGLADFGSIKVPVPRDGTVTVEPTANGRLQAVHIALPGGRLSVSALAAPKSSALWPELVAEIDSSLREGGARVRSFRGEWGRELHARTGAADSVFIGVDGARWMLYGVATGPTEHAVGLEGALRTMLKGTVVDRGRSPYPVRTVLPLVVPEHLTDAVVEGTGTVPGPPPAATSPTPAEPAPVARPEPVAPPTTAIPVQPRPVPRRAVPERLVPERPVPVRPAPARPAPIRSAPIRSAPVRPEPVRAATPARRVPDGVRPAAVDVTQALPVSPPVARSAPAPASPARMTPAPVPPAPPAGPAEPETRRRTDPSVPLWAAAPTGVTDADFGPEPGSAVPTEPWALPPADPTPAPRSAGPARPLDPPVVDPPVEPPADDPASHGDEEPTRWWPAVTPALASVDRVDEPPVAVEGHPAEPEPSGWGPEVWVADTPLHDELLPTHRWPAVPTAEVSPTERWPAVHPDGPPTAGRPDASQWGATQWGTTQWGATQWGATQWEMAGPSTGRPAAPRHRSPVDTGPVEFGGPAEFGGGRRRAPEPPHTEGRRRADDRVDLDALVRDRPGRRRARYEPEPVRPGRRRASDTDPRDPDPPVDRTDPSTEPLEPVRGEPDWSRPPGGPDGDAPALAFLASRPQPRAGRHHRPGP